jgi:hypothetical protein
VLGIGEDQNTLARAAKAKNSEAGARGKGFSFFDTIEIRDAGTLSPLAPLRE